MRRPSIILTTSTRPRPMSALRETYAQTTWRGRALTALLLAAVFAAIAWQAGYQAWTGAAVGAGLVIAAHVLLAWGYHVRIALVLLAQTAVISWIGFLFASLAPNAAGALTGSVIVLSVASLVILVLSRYSRGHVWLTLTLAYLAMDSAAVFSVNWIQAYAGLLGMAVGLGALTLRIIYPRRAAFVPDTGDADALVERLGEGYKTRVVRPGVLVATDTKGHVSVLNVIRSSAPITVDQRSGLRVDGQPLDPWLLQAARETSRIARGALTAIAVQGNGLSADYIPVALQSRSGRDLGAVAIIRGQHANRALTAVLEDFRPTPWSKDQIERLAVRLADTKEN